MSDTKNLIAAMFDIEKVKQLIANCPQDEVVILCGHWSINKPKYPEDADPETESWDWDEFEKMIDTFILVSDYDDLVADPHGVYACP